MNQNIKGKIKDYCLLLTNNRINEVETAIKLAQEALVSDTKGSAGDKYETSREMLQQDLTRYSNQLAIAKEDFATLTNLDLNPKKMIGLGSLVETSNGTFFISVGIGKIEIVHQLYFAISANSPLAEQLHRKMLNDQFVFNQKDFLIKNIT